MDLDLEISRQTKAVQLLSLPDNNPLGINEKKGNEQDKFCHDQGGRKERKKPMTRRDLLKKNYLSDPASLKFVRRVEAAPPPKPNAEFTETRPAPAVIDSEPIEDTGSDSGKDISNHVDEVTVEKRPEPCISISNRPHQAPEEAARDNQNSPQSAFPDRWPAVNDDHPLQIMDFREEVFKDSSPSTGTDCLGVLRPSFPEEFGESTGRALENFLKSFPELSSTDPVGPRKAPHPQLAETRRRYRYSDVTPPRISDKTSARGRTRIVYRLSYIGIKEEPYEPLHLVRDPAFHAIGGTFHTRHDYFRVRQLCLFERLL